MHAKVKSTTIVLILILLIQLHASNGFISTGSNLYRLNSMMRMVAVPPPWNPSKSSSWGNVLRRSATESNDNRILSFLKGIFDKTSATRTGIKLTTDATRIADSTAITADLQQTRYRKLHTTTGSWKAKRQYRKSSRIDAASYTYGMTPQWQLYYDTLRELQQSNSRIHFTAREIVVENGTDGTFTAVNRDDRSLTRSFYHRGDIHEHEGYTNRNQEAKLERDLIQNIRGIYGRGRPTNTPLM